MSTTITGSLPASTYGYNAPAESSGVAPVAATTDPDLPQTAVTLAADASVIAALGAGPAAGLTYDAAGLLNSFMQAGNSSSSAPQASAAGPQAAQQSQDQAVVASLPSTSATSGIYTASGALQALPTTSVSSDWATILKTNPGLAATAMADAMNQGIVGTLSATA